MPYITLNSNRIFYLTAGDGETAVILVHGLMLSSGMWLHYYMPRLSGTYRVFAPDMRGHGNSIPAAGCTIGNMADDIAEFIRVMALKSVVFIGVSMGGGVGVQLALNHPELLSSLVLVSPVTGLGASGAFMFKILGSLIAQKRWLLRILLKSLCTVTPPKDLFTSTLDDAMKVKAAVLKDFIGADPPITGIENIGRMSVPTLVVGGRKDSAVPVAQQIKLADTIPSAEKRFFDDSGHMVAYEKKEEVMEEILRFLAKGTAG